MSDFDDIPEAAITEEVEPVLVGIDALPAPEVEDGLSAFNRKFQVTLEERRQAESEAEKSMKQKASEDLSSWTAQRNARLAAKKDKNRSEEQVLLESVESEADGNAWERVTKLIDISAEAADAKKSDVTRMRKVFIQLKNEPLESTRGN